MGPPFVMIFWAVLLTPIAVLIGVPLSFLGPFIYYTIRGTPAILWGITKYEKRGPLVAGFYEEEHSWFLFDCTNGALAKFTDRESLHKACTDKGFTSLPAMMSIRDNWHCYWHDPNRRKK